MRGIFWVAGGQGMQEVTDRLAPGELTFSPRLYIDVVSPTPYHCEGGRSNVKQVGWSLLPRA
jgi:hypothetical protein